MGVVRRAWVGVGVRTRLGGVSWEGREGRKEEEGRREKGEGDLRRWIGGFEEGEEGGGEFEEFEGLLLWGGEGGEGD